MPASVANIALPDWAEPLFAPRRYKNLYGGRGSGKSHTVAAALVIIAAQSRKRILCGREFQVSIKQSVKQLLEEKIETLGLSSHYEIQEQIIRSQCGSEFIFAGLHHNVDNIKSMEGVDIVWLEEAQSISEATWAKLIPTIRKDGSEIWLTWNPDDETDPTYKRFVTDCPTNCVSLKLTWQDNPWFPDVLRAEKDALYARDPDAADWVWGGNPRKVSAAQVLRGRWVVEAFEPKQDWHGPYYGADWGFSVDPTVLVRCWINGRKLYIEHEAYGVGVDLDDTPKLFDAVPGARKHTIRADSARPETISHMRRHGFPQMLGVTKRPGSVDDGVEHLRSYEQIVIHPQCPHAAEEARLWSYRTDKLSGDVLPVLLDKHDHCWDAVRYALDPIIRAGKPTAPPPKPPPKRPDYQGRKSSTADRWKVI